MLTSVLFSTAALAAVGDAPPVHDAAPLDPDAARVRFDQERLLVEDPPVPSARHRWVVRYPDGSALSTVELMRVLDDEELEVLWRRSERNRVGRGRSRRSSGPPRSTPGWRPRPTRSTTTPGRSGAPWW